MDRQTQTGTQRDRDTERQGQRETGSQRQTGPQKNTDRETQMRKRHREGIILKTSDYSGISRG